MKIKRYINKRKSSHTYYNSVKQYKAELINKDCGVTVILGKQFLIIQAFTCHKSQL